MRGRVAFMMGSLTVVWGSMAFVDVLDRYSMDSRMVQGGSMNRSVVNGFMMDRCMMDSCMVNRSVMDRSVMNRSMMNRSVMNRCMVLSRMRHRFVKHLFMLGGDSMHRCNLLLSRLGRLLSLLLLWLRL